MNKDILHNFKFFREGMFDTDEVFLSNAIEGVKWIEKFEEKKYQSHKIARLVFNKLNT